MVSAENEPKRESGDIASGQGVKGAQTEQTDKQTARDRRN